MIRTTKTDAPALSSEGADIRITVTSNATPTSTANASAFVSIWDQVQAGAFTTTRKCDPVGCWCHAETTGPLTHDQEMARMARAIRALEIAHGVIT